MRRGSSALVGSVLVIGWYMLVRACVYQWLPVVSVETWFVRDTWMTIPQLLAFAALLMMNRRWEVAAWTMPWREGARAVGLGWVPVGLYLFYFSAGEGPSFKVPMMGVGFFTSLVVGLFEECAFRGALLAALAQRFSLFSAVVLSNVMFAAFHIQAQPVAAWPSIFLLGVIFAHLRLRGLSLGWLAMVHGVLDAAWFWFPWNAPAPFGFDGVVLQAGLLMYAVVSFPRGRVADARAAE